MAEATTGAATCADCSTSLTRKPGGGRPPKLCAPCLSERGRLRQQARYAAKHGSPKTELVCVDCTTVFERASMNGAPATRCPDCARKRENAQQYARMQQQREERPRPDGRKSTCERCGEVFDLARKGPVATACPPCRTARATEYTREWRRAKAGPAPVLHCCDCQVEIFRKLGSGSAPKRCRACAVEKDRERVRKWQARQPKASLDCECIDCGRRFQRFSRRGHPPLRCPECTIVRSRTRSAVYQRQVSLRRYLVAGRWSSCDRCGERIALARKGPKTRLCQPCSRTVRIETYWAVRGKAPGDVMACPDCGTDVPLLPKGTSRRRCSGCATARQRQQSEDSFRNASPERRAAKWRRHNHRRRAAKRGAGSERFNDRDIFIRDRWICQICKRKVNPALRYPDPMSASLDHTVPLAEGGAHSRANTRCTHWICNARRGDRGGNEQLALIG